MGLEGTVDFDFRDLFRELDGMGKRGKNLRPVFQRLEPFMRADQLQNFKRKEGPRGKWPPKAASTKARNKFRRGKTGKPPRALLGKKLRTGFSISFDRRQIMVRSKIDFSGVLQDGGTVGKGSKIPSRVHHWMSAQFLEIAEREISKHVFGKFGKRGGV